MISSPGIGSGLNINSIISQLMSLERRPLNIMERQQREFDAQLSAYGRLNSAVSEFETAMDKLGDLSKFQVFSATSGDEGIFTATADSSAAVGTFDIEILNLAVNQKSASAAFADAGTTTIGNAGEKINIQVGAGTFSVDIGGKTLNQIRDDINDAADNLGVTATVLNDDAGYRLVLTSDETGTANAMSLSFEDSGATPITDPLTMTTTRAAEDAIIEVDGFTATRSSNTISDVIEGVTLSLKAENTPSTTTLTIGQDADTIKESVQAFADAFNNLRETISTLRNGDLAGDNTLLSIESRLLGVVNTGASGLTGSFSFLSEVGLSIQKDGTMAVDDAELTAALQTDFSGFAELFGHQGQGFANRFESLAGDLLGSNGLLKIRTDGIGDRIDALEVRMDQTERRLITTEERYRAQFTALDALLGQLNSTSTFLGQQLASLNSTVSR